MNITTVCTGCGQPKLLCEFMGFGANGTSTKQYHTCNSCHARNSQQKKNKRSYKKDGNTDPLEVVEAADIFDYIKQLLSMYTTQTENEENMLPFHFKCKVDIEDADEFSHNRCEKLGVWIFVLFD